MQLVSLIWGILALVGMAVAFFPCLGSLNWLNIPFAVAGLIVSVIALASAKPGDRGRAIGGVVCCSVAIFFGLIRLALGGGVL